MQMKTVLTIAFIALIDTLNAHIENNIWKTIKPE
jgi:hypothetical protein